VAARYHPGVIWGPFLLALALGLVVSAGLYFAYLWPQVEPEDEALDPVGANAGTAGPAAGSSDDGDEADSNAADNKATQAAAKTEPSGSDAAGEGTADEAGPSETEAEADVPKSESSPA
jgi:hypothetical protein